MQSTTTRSVARDDADIGVPLSREFFEWAADVVLSGKMDPALHRSGADVESACGGDDVRREPHDHWLSCQYDRGRIRTGTSASRFLGLRAFWHSDYDP